MSKVAKIRTSPYPRQEGIIRTIGPVKRCIYCPATTLTDGAKLTREHIIPLTLDGQIILLEASCDDCQKKINEFENVLINGPFYLIRLQLKLKRRKRNSRIVPPRTIRLYLDAPPSNRAIDVPMEDYPTSVVFPKFSPCRLLRKPDEDDQYTLVHVHGDLNAFRHKYGITSFRTPGFYLSQFCRLLAKIAHGYTVATFGLENFSPFLIDLILGRSANYSEFIGGPAYEIPNSRYLWEVFHDFVDIDGRVLIIAKFRIFGNFGAPAYEVVAGELSPQVRVLRLPF